MQKIQKVNKEAGCWKGKFALFWMPAARVWGGIEGGHLSKGQLRPLKISGQELL